MTDSHSSKRAAELFRAALTRDGSQRAAFLETECGEDEGLRREVLSLLSSSSSSDPSLGPLLSEATGAGGDPLTATRAGDADLQRVAERLGGRLAHYEIVSPIGVGGMGAVFQARDLVLGRDVAIKVIHESLSTKPERLRRFEREARAAAALNHPNIATVYEIGEHEGRRFIVMELVEGRTLSAVLRDGPLPFARAIDFATQIASGLARAHAAGIVHRDLKPGNLMVTSDGLAKILDFGLVKMLPHASLGDEEITGERSIVGTVQYMSPEQAHGRPVDHRSDQFSLGAILYEMVTGSRPFQGDGALETVAAILRDQPRPVRRVNPAVPARFAAIVERCLAKDATGRYDSTSDLAAELAAVGRAEVSLPARRTSRWLALAGLLAATAGLVWAALSQRAPAPSATVLNPVPLTSYPGREGEPSFSPDGSRVAFSWNGSDQANRDVYVKPIGAERPLRLTTDPALDGSPAWSSDGSRIAFLREKPGGGSEIRLIDPEGGGERLLAEVAASAEYGLSWSPDDRRLAAVDRPSPGRPHAIFLIDTATGEKQPLTSLEAIAGRGDAWPRFSPDGRMVAFKRSVAPTANYVCVVPATGGEPVQVAPTTAIWSPVAWTADGREILFSALAQLREGAPPVPSTRSNSGAPPVLWRIAAGGGPARQLVGSQDAMGVAVSREGDRLAFAQQMVDWDIWRIDLEAAQPGVQTRLIASTRFDGNGQYSPDDAQVVLTSARSGSFEIWTTDRHGNDPVRLTSFGNRGSAGSPRWSPDGESVAFDFLAEGDTGADIWVVSARGGEPRRITTSPSPDVRPSWSRDGRWIYFGSHRSGEWQVWKVPAPGEDGDNARVVTQGGGYAAIESHDGRDLYFSKRRSFREDPENAIWRIPVDGGEEAPVIESLFSSDTNWDVTPAGIYYVDRRDSHTPRERWVVSLVDPDGGLAREITELLYPPRLAGPALSVSSDGRSILVSQLHDEADLMLVEGFR